eukprot:2351177-Prymnesium_polylepis.1
MGGGGAEGGSEGDCVAPADTSVAGVAGGASATAPSTRGRPAFTAFETTPASFCRSASRATPFSLSACRSAGRPTPHASVSTSSEDARAIGLTGPCAAPPVVAALAGGDPPDSAASQLAIFGRCSIRKQKLSRGANSGAARVAGSSFLAIKMALYAVRLPRVGLGATGMGRRARYVSRGSR